MNSLLVLGDMAGFITAITGTDGITSANLWAQITPAGGFLAALVIFAFGYRVIRRLISGASKGRARV